MSISSSNNTTSCWVEKLWPKRPGEGNRSGVRAVLRICVLSFRFGVGMLLWSRIVFWISAWDLGGSLCLLFWKG